MPNYFPKESDQQIKIAQNVKSCQAACSPSDFYEGGKCDKMGCYKSPENQDVKNVVENPPPTNRRVSLSNLLKAVKNCRKVSGLDWLEVNVEVVPELLVKIEKVNVSKMSFGEKIWEFKKEEVTVRVLNTPSKLMKFKIEVHVNGELFSSGLYSGRSGVNGISANTWLCKISNEALYRYEPATILDWLNNLDILVSIKKLIRLDIYCDIQMNISKCFWPYLEKCKSSESFQIANNNTITINGWNTNEGYPESITLGRKSSETQVAIYNKSAELLVSGKNYIKETWKDVFDLSKGDIYRIEVRVTGDYFHSYEMDTDGLDLSFDVLKVMYRDVLHSKLTLLEVNEKKDRRYWQKWRMNPLEHNCKIARVKKAERIKANGWFAKVFIKKLVDLYMTKTLSKVELQYIVEYFGEVSEGSNLGEWLFRAMPKWKSNYTTNDDRWSLIWGLLCSLVNVSNVKVHKTALYYLRNPAMHPQDCILSTGEFGQFDRMLKRLKEVEGEIESWQN